MTTPNLEQIDQFAEIVWRKACDRARAAEGNPPTTAKWEDVVTQDEWRSMVTDVIAAIRDSGLTVIALPEMLAEDITEAYEGEDDTFVAGYNAALRLIREYVLPL